MRSRTARPSLALLAAVLRGGNGRLEPLARSAAPDRVNLSPVDLAGTLTERLAGTSASVSARFAGSSRSGRRHAGSRRPTTTIDRPPPRLRAAPRHFPSGGRMLCVRVQALRAQRTFCPALASEPRPKTRATLRRARADRAWARLLLDGSLTVCRQSGRGQSCFERCSRPQWSSLLCQRRVAAFRIRLPTRRPLLPFRGQPLPPQG